ncbi:hypothetical protein FSARC_4028 [Fusarium sarcochroum]|uniref:ATP-dependent DNA helicase n=1 Tax=Fusarium sarcochroum TaxID=1208366 RepID=A0A8H4U343_9HYPO|nr:hypothetical protein FSARC_4028 [Fusarium sarcochroum]
MTNGDDEVAYLLNVPELAIITPLDWWILGNGSSQYRGQLAFSIYYPQEKAEDQRTDYAYSAVYEGIVSYIVCCGKSTVLKAAVERLRLGGRTVYITAPTGIAALQVGGTSTWAYMGWTPADHKRPLPILKDRVFRTQVKDRLQKTDVLIIDEISMVENHHLERINECMKTVKCYAQTPQKYRPDAPAFGGAQVIMTGDFCQLSPVKPFQNCYLCGGTMLPDEDNDEYTCDDGHGPFSDVDKWAFRSSAWEEANFVHVNLEQIHRQSDQSFVRMLQKCRLGIPFSSAEANTLRNHQCDVRNATQLFAINKKVDQLNQAKFDQMPGEDIMYNALDGFDWNTNHLEIEHYSIRTPDGLLEECGRNHSLDSLVELNTGALVMLKVNLDLPRGLINGSQGTVCGWEKFDPAKLPRAYKKNKSSEFDIDVLGGDYARLRERQVRVFADKQVYKDWPIVQFHNGVKRTIYPWCVVTALGSTEPYSLLYRTQVPLSLAWAVSIHKSQGMTLNRVIVNLHGFWEHSQVYVALSRATSLGGLRVIAGRQGLEAGKGANLQVREFLLAMFGEGLFRRHGDLTVGS